MLSLADPGIVETQVNARRGEFQTLGQRQLTVGLHYVLASMVS
jgi:hypothetical protein